MYGSVFMYRENFPFFFISFEMLLFFFQHYIEAEESYRKVLSLDSECEDARRQLLDVQVMHLCQLGYNKEQALKALHLTVDNIKRTASIEVMCVVCRPVGSVISFSYLVY
jgi:hypothetical protein